MSVQVQHSPGDTTKIPSVEEILSAGIKFDVEDDPLVVWDKGVFLSELLRQSLVLSTDSKGAADGGLDATKQLQTGTYQGTRTALTEIYSLLEEAHVSVLDQKAFEPIIPMKRQVASKKAAYQWSDGTDRYPPHLAITPPDELQGTAKVGMVFDDTLTKSVGSIASVFSFVIPVKLGQEGKPAEGPYVGPTLADVESYNQRVPSGTTDIMNGKNIGHLPDWYSDSRFAQQHLSGVNPVTIKTAPPVWVKAYVDQAGKQNLAAMKKLLSESKDLLIQDYSYFREATGVTDDQAFMNAVPELNGKTPTGKVAFRYACASVVLFQLFPDGRLHPLAITLDYKGSLDKSVTIFNRRLSPTDTTGGDEKSDWPWRYAKTCAQTADWAAHEVAVHLVDTHLIEEAIIVATNRIIPENHLIYEILSPHWFRTLALNAAARQTLIPAVIARLAGFGPSIDPATSRTFGLVNYAYKNFNFQEKYVPNDLKKRGFNLTPENETKYRNYPYAKCMSILWGIIRDFVQSVVKTQYKTDADVQADFFISIWCVEIQDSGKITTFPTITTVDQLVDALTMCIHTASPQHTAVNYLQNYYYNFVPAKPPALCTPLPTTLQALQSYKEADLLAALPIGVNGPQWKDWLLAAQLPELLSFRVEGRYNLINYAKSLYNVNKERTAFENAKFDATTIKKAAALFYSRLKVCEGTFDTISKAQSDGVIEYKVLQPETTAVSILI